MSQMMPPGWAAYQTGDGRWYYTHAPSGVTQWNPPPPNSPAPSPYPPQPQQRPHHHSASPPHPQQSAARPSSHAMASSSGQYVYNHPVEFKLKEKAFSLSGDAFSIKRTDTKEAVFKVKGNAFSLKDSKTLFDVNGTPLYKMSESILSLRGRMQIQDAKTKKPVITLRKKNYFSIAGLGGGGIQAWTGASDDGQPYLQVKGDFFKKDFTIKEVATGRVLASVKRKSFNLSNILLEKDTYVIRIEPGQDAALFVFFVIAVDEQYRDDGTRNGMGSFL